MRSYKIILIIFISAIFTGCEDVIEVELDSAGEQIVIEAGITNKEINNSVIITKSTDFYEPGVYETVSEADINLSDSDNNSELLIETEPGYYRVSSLKGTPGKTYSLRIDVEGEEYIAESTMPNPIEVDSVIIKASTIGRSGDNSYDLRVFFQDRPGEENYCRFKVFQNEELLPGIFLYSDRLSEGNYISQRIRFDGEDYDIQKGDTIRGELLTIDAVTYEYFQTLKNVTASTDANQGPGGGGSVSPANPITNWSNEALGYFAAYTISEAATVVTTEGN